MKPGDLTVEQVRRELESLINNYPGRNGRVEINSTYDQYACVYYTEEDGTPVSMSNWANSVESCDVSLATPVCIIGQWIEDFHPEFKQDDLIESILRENATLSACERSRIPFDRDVWVLLAYAQNVQDDRGKSWGDINLDAREY